MSALMGKWSVSYWRSPSYNLVRFVMTLLIALFYGARLALHSRHSQAVHSKIVALQEQLLQIASCSMRCCTAGTMYWHRGKMPAQGMQLVAELQQDICWAYCYTSCCLSLRAYNGSQWSVLQQGIRMCRCNHCGCAECVGSAVLLAAVPGNVQPHDGPAGGWL